MKPNGTWKGFAGVIPASFETDPISMPAILQTLNDMEKLIVKSSFNAEPLFHFEMNDENQVTYTCKDPAFILDLTGQLAHENPRGMNGNP